MAVLGGFSGYPMTLTEILQPRVFWYVAKCLGIALWLFCCAQNANDEAAEEIDVTQMMKNVEKVDPSYFELLKVLGQGSFGKVQKIAYDSPVVKLMSFLPLRPI